MDQSYIDDAWESLSLNYQPAAGWETDCEFARDGSYEMLYGSQSVGPDEAWIIEEDGMHDSYDKAFGAPADLDGPDLYWTFFHEGAHHADFDDPYTYDLEENCFPAT